MAYLIASVAVHPASKFEDDLYHSLKERKWKGMIKISLGNAARLMVACYHLLMGPAMTERERTNQAVLKAQIEKPRTLAQAQLQGYRWY